MQISKLDITKLEFHIKDWEVSPYKSKHQQHGHFLKQHTTDIIIFITISDDNPA